MNLAYILIYIRNNWNVPKGIVRDIGGHIVALKWTMKNIYNIDTLMMFGGQLVILDGLLDTHILYTLLYSKDALQFYLKVSQ